MDSWIQALLIITVPLDLTIALAGMYLIRAYTSEQTAIREAAHDAEITNREQIRFNTALAKSGQYEQGSGTSDLIGQVIAAAAPTLLAKLTPPAAPPIQENKNG